MFNTLMHRARNAVDGDQHERECMGQRSEGSERTKIDPSRLGEVKRVMKSAEGGIRERGKG